MRPLAKLAELDSAVHNTLICCCRKIQKKSITKAMITAKSSMSKSFRFVDLFAGLGGFHVALSRLGGKCVFAAEWDPQLQHVYKQNFGMRPAGNINDVPLSDIPDHDLLTAGFPCQPFSKAGEQRGFECTEQGGLFFNVAKILKHKKPKYFILENVPNLLKHDQGETWRKIQRVLGKTPQGLGYNIKAELLSPHDFGIPQIRKRVYIVGSLAPLESFVWPQTIGGVTSIETILDKSPDNPKQLSDQKIKCLKVWNQFIKACPRGVEIPSFPLWSMEWGATYPFETTTPFSRKTLSGTDGLKGYKASHGKPIGVLRTLEERWLALPSHARTNEIEFPTWKKDFIRKNRMFYLENKSWIDPWLPKILEFPSSLQKLEWNVKGGKRDIWSYVLQFRASGVRVKQRSTAPSLVAMTDSQVPIIGWERRYMTPTECARLQNLESLRHYPSSTIQTFRALGNAVNTKVVELVARALLNR